MRKTLLSSLPAISRILFVTGISCFPTVFYHVALVPQGISYPNSDYQTTDEALVLAGA
ncbi:MAG: hypothetical protein KHX59_03430 [Prevotella sp.]|nr:hypothetical protein [Prevotella sp.]